jgi:hypothetical protein
LAAYSSVQFSRRGTKAKMNVKIKARAGSIRLGNKDARLRSNLLHSHVFNKRLRNSRRLRRRNAVSRKNAFNNNRRSSGRNVCHRRSRNSNNSSVFSRCRRSNRNVRNGNACKRRHGPRNSSSPNNVSKLRN